MVVGLCLSRFRYRLYITLGRPPTLYSLLINAALLPILPSKWSWWVVLGGSSGRSTWMVVIVPFLLQHLLVSLLLPPLSVLPNHGRPHTRRQIRRAYFRHEGQSLEDYFKSALLPP